MHTLQRLLQNELRAIFLARNSAKFSEMPR
jgi:hypothetical protein